MIPAQQPPEDRARVSQETIDEVESCLRRYLTAPDDDGLKALHRALARAGREGRKRELSPESLIIAFKELEQRVARDLLQAGRVDTRLTLLRIMIEAYYSA